MRALAWIKTKILGRPPPIKDGLIKEIAREQGRLDGAMENLAHQVEELKNDKVRNRATMTMLLDETLEALKKERRG